MIAITSKTCIMPPALYAKKPTAQNTISITAIKYKRFPMVYLLILIIFKFQFIIGIIEYKGVNLFITINITFHNNLNLLHNSQNQLIDRAEEETNILKLYSEIFSISNLAIK